MTHSITTAIGWSLAYVHCYINKLFQNDLTRQVRKYNLWKPLDNDDICWCMEYKMRLNWIVFIVEKISRVRYDGVKTLQSILENVVHILEWWNEYFIWFSIEIDFIWSSSRHRSAAKLDLIFTLLHCFISFVKALYIVFSIVWVHCFKSSFYTTLS